MATFNFNTISAKWPQRIDRKWNWTFGGKKSQAGNSKQSSTSSDFYSAHTGSEQDNCIDWWVKLYAFYSLWNIIELIVGSTTNSQLLKSIHLIVGQPIAWGKSEGQRESTRFYRVQYTNVKCESSMIWYCVLNNDVIIFQFKRSITTLLNYSFQCPIIKYKNKLVISMWNFGIYENDYLDHIKSD